MNVLVRPRHFAVRPLHHAGQRRWATLLKRPKRPYTFSQLVTLSDGSTFLHRTTSPEPVYISVKDTRNTPMWNPSSQKLLNVEADEAGKLRAFRARFGRGWDARREEPQDEDHADDRQPQAKTVGATDTSSDQDLFELISGFGQAAEAQSDAKGVRDSKTRSGKGKGGEK